MIKLEHSLFSLPFVISSALLAIRSLNYENYNLINFLWIALCLLGARSCGMTLNRIFDADIDKENPRTADREIPKGNMTKTQAWFYALASLGILIFSTFQLPSLCQMLLPVAILWLFAYSWLKRLTWLCHFFLGTTLGGAVLGAWIAIKGEALEPAPYYLSLAVAFWVAGFDIYYATQDAEFDQEKKLHSIPAKFGRKAAIQIARFSHFLTPVFLYLTATELNLGLIFKLGILLVVFALLYERKLVDENKIEAAFFVVNSWISVLIMLFTILDMFL